MITSLSHIYILAWNCFLILIGVQGRIHESRMEGSYCRHRQVGRIARKKSAFIQQQMR